MDTCCNINKFQVIILLILLAAVVISRSVAASEMGPFNMPPIGLSEMFRETPQFVAPNDHKEGRFQVNASLRWLNIWAYHMASEPPYEWENPPADFPLEHGNYLADMESYSLNYRISYKASEQICAEISVPVVLQTGGIGDGFVEHFHDAFGIGDQNRKALPRNQVNGFYVTKAGGLDDFSDDLKGIFLGNIIVGGTYLVKSGYPNIAVRALCKLPTSTMDESFNSNSVDFSFQASTTWNSNRFYGHHGLGATFYGTDGLDELKLNRERFSMFSALEYSCSETFSVIAQLVAASAVADYSKLNDPVVEVILGFKAKIGPGVFEFGLIENMLYFDNSPDGGIHIGYTFSK